MNKITINTYWDLVGEDLTEAMEEINNSPLTTRNHYGQGGVMSVNIQSMLLMAPAS